VLTVASFFAHWPPETQTVIAAVGGVVLVVLVSAASTLERVGSVVSRSTDSITPEASVERDGSDEDAHPGAQPTR
jgi:hypothetical protein